MRTNVLRWVGFGLVADRPEQITWKRALLRVGRKVVPDFYHPPAGVLFPSGHIISDCPPPHVRHLYSVPTIAQFKDSVDFLCQRFRPLQLSELPELPGRRNNNGIPRSFILSFDDGMREISDVVAPILREKGLRAIFFIDTSTTDNKRLMWRHKISLVIDRFKASPGPIPPQIRSLPGNTFSAKLKALHFTEESTLDEIASLYGVDFDAYLTTHRPYLTTEQILALSREGFEIGAHSHGHPVFAKLTPEEQKEQISASVDAVRALGLPCRYFAFPFEDHGVSLSIFKHMADLGLILSFGTNGAHVDSVPFSFQRFGIDEANSDLTMRDLLRQLSAKSLVLRLSGTEVIRRS